MLMALASAVEPNVKVKTPCAQGADVTQCAACSALSEEQWTHPRESYVKMSANRNRSGSQGDSFTRYRRASIYR